MPNNGSKVGQSDDPQPRKRRKPPVPVQRLTGIYERGSGRATTAEFIPLNKLLEIDAAVEWGDVHHAAGEGDTPDSVLPNLPRSVIDGFGDECLDKTILTQIDRLHYEAMCLFVSEEQDFAELANRRSPGVRNDIRASAQDAAECDAPCARVILDVWRDIASQKNLPELEIIKMSLAMWAIGSQAERLRVRRHEHRAAASLRISAGARKGRAVSLAKKHVEMAEEAEVLQARVDALMKDGLSYHGAVAKIAKEADLSESVVKARTYNPAPRKKK